MCLANGRDFDQEYRIAKEQQAKRFFSQKKVCQTCQTNAFKFLYGWKKNLTIKGECINGHKIEEMPSRPLADFE